MLCRPLIHPNSHRHLDLISTFIFSPHLSLPSQLEEAGRPSQSGRCGASSIEAEGGWWRSEISNPLVRSVQTHGHQLGQLMLVLFIVQYFSDLPNAAVSSSLPPPNPSRLHDYNLSFVGNSGRRPPGIILTSCANPPHILRVRLAYLTRF